MDYERSQGNRCCKEEETNIEEINNMSKNHGLTPYKLWLFGKEISKQAENNGFRERLCDIIERNEMMYGPTLFGAGYGINQEKTAKKFFDMSEIEDIISTNYEDSEVGLS